jgi:hypothetical protein
MEEWASSNVISNRCITIMLLKPTQLQVTTMMAQENAIIERVQKILLIHSATTPLALHREIYSFLLPLSWERLQRKGFSF